MQCNTSFMENYYPSRHQRAPSKMLCPSFFQDKVEREDWFDRIKNDECTTVSTLMYDKFPCLWSANMHQSMSDTWDKEIGRSGDRTWGKPLLLIFIKNKQTNRQTNAIKNKQMQKANQQMQQRNNQTKQMNATHKYMLQTNQLLVNQQT